MRASFLGFSKLDTLIRPILAGIVLFGSALTTRAVQSVQIVNGSKITITVNANGTPPLAYQWKRNGTDIPGATSTSFVINPSSAVDAGTYTAVVSNNAGSLTSEEAILSVGLVAPTISVQPINDTVQVGGTSTFTVVATGSTPLNYQWRKNGANLSNAGNISGATSDTLTIANAAAGDGANYTVFISNGAGSVTSAIATLTIDNGNVPPPVVNQVPVITLHPTAQFANSGDTIIFTAEAIGLPAPTYQWQKDGANILNGGLISGATTNTLTMTGVTPADNGSYTMIATNVLGSVSTDAAALLTVVIVPVVNQAPVIDTQPASRTVFAGDSVSFTVSVSALPAASYQWRKDGVNLSNNANVTGVSFPALTLSNLTIADSGNYSVVATNSLGSATSANATLEVVTNRPPVITVHPASQSVNTGAVVFFTARASGIPSPTSNWQRNGVNLSNGGNITGAKSNTLTLSNVTEADAGNYTYVAENSLGHAVSNPAGLSISGTPAFLSQPPAISVVSSGTIVKLAVTVAGDPAPTLQWRKDGANLANGGVVSGATSATLTFAGATVADSGSYSVVATNSRGTATAGPFALTVNPGNVWYQPVTEGKDTALSQSGATGNLKWQVSNAGGWTDLANDGTYAGVTTSTLRITNATSAMNSLNYRLVSVGTGEPTVLKTARLDVGAALLPFPVGISADASGNLYVADTSIDTISKINPSGQVVSWAGSSGQTGTADGAGSTARFNNPNGIASSLDGSLLVTDNANGTIRSISSSGTVLTVAGSTTLRGNVDGTGTAATFSSPIGIARDTAGTYYVADSTNHTLRKIASGMVVSTLAGSAGQSGNNDGTGNGARFNNLTRVAADPSGNLYVADTTNNLIRKVTPTGVVTQFAGLSGVSGITDGKGTGALFNQPGGIAVDGSGYVYVADTGNSTIRRISPAGDVITIAGLPGIAGHKDGSGTEAWFNQPRDISISSTGFLYIADTGNAAIRKIASDASVTTLALTALQTTPDPITPPTLPTTPTLPNPSPTPTLPTSPTPVTPSSGGGGGGAPSFWFLGALGLLWIVNRRRSRTTVY